MSQKQNNHQQDMIPPDWNNDDEINNAWAHVEKEIRAVYRPIIALLHGRRSKVAVVT